MEYNVVLTQRAKQDLAAIWIYLRQRAPEEADSFCQRLVARARKLKTFPSGYPRLRFNPEIRHVTFGSYSIVFGINQSEGRVEVYRFWHGAQSPRRFRLRESAARYGTPS